MLLLHETFDLVSWADVSAQLMFPCSELFQS